MSIGRVTVLLRHLRGLAGLDEVLGQTIPMPMAWHR
jgi:hypothetical protein